MAKCRQGRNHQGPGPYCARCGQWIQDGDGLHKRWVKDGKLYDTEIADRLHIDVDSDGMPKEALFRSPHGQFFTVSAPKSGNINQSATSDLINQKAALKWLEKHNAPPEAYEAGGWTIEEA